MTPAPDSPDPRPQPRRIRLDRGRYIAVVGVIVTIFVAVNLWIGHETYRIDSFTQCAEAGYPITDTNPPSCSDGRRTYLGADLATPSASPTAVVTTLEFTLLVNAQYGGDYPETKQVITTQADWRSYWHAVHHQINPEPPLLPVDFATENVVALNAGPKSSGGYTLSVSSVTTGGAGTTVNVTEQTPGAKCAVTASLTSPYYIIKTPKLATPVSFRTTTKVHGCD